MCEYCTQHGEGKKWYLRAENYSEDLLSDLRRRRFITDFFAHPEHLQRESAQLDSLRKAPAFVQRVVRSLSVRHMKKWHYGQVLPLEDIRTIFGFVNSVVRLPCICRYTGLGKEARYCYGLSMGPGGGRLREILDGLDDSFISGPDTSGFEDLTPDEALQALTDHESEGLCHTVWTFRAPFIGGLCNCDRSDCMAMQATVVHDFPVMFRAEYVARIDPDLCAGCRSCMRACQFGALAYSATNQQAVVDQTACYGCGICRSMCRREAITLTPRADSPVAANLW